MKSIAICVFTLFTLVFLGCKQQKEEEQSNSQGVVEEITVVPEQNAVPVERYFTDAPVAAIKNGEIEYTDYDAFLEKWKSFTGKKGSVTTIEIKKADVEEADDDFYMVLASGNDKKIKFGALLVMRDSKLYYYGPDDVVLVIMCKGSVDNDIEVAYDNGRASLSCSQACTDCIKREGAFMLKRSK
ncbi:hypothetical protein GN157_02840 [Flavobacterium rakeshii]|uniref:Lipoprotein n=1 Tax=Flavobacterium rakeshii TaxID=1038845 RepID=A0A6N8HDS0_9FLAO|nr:hypothetical protein [Flavobacterium rakeshii]MEE1897746.1 hypothetical protein [Flavobacterium rakeshii]MUV02637.1 hypothetical protein [Flavobacterium rakeshii]